jgi:hypothetical protein
LITKFPGPAAPSFRRRREACESSVLVRPNDRKSQTSLSKCSLE